MSNSKDMKQLLTDLERNGFSVEQRKRSSPRMRVTAPDGAFTFLGTSVGDSRSVLNARSWAASHGFKAETGKKGKQKVSPIDTRRSGETAASAARRIATATSAPPRSVFADPAADDPIEEPVVEDISVEAPAPPARERVPRGRAMKGSSRVMPSRPAPDVPRAAVSARSELVPAEFDGLPEDHPAWPVNLVAPMGDGVWIEISRSVSPELAATLLDHNTWNRSAPGRVVGGYARDMQSGGFYDKQGDPIRFAGNGQLLDGQQRLMGQVESGATLTYNVVSGLPTTAQETMDRGRKRTVADQLRLARVTAPEVVGSAAKILWELDNQAFLSKVPAATPTEILEKVLECQEFEIDLEKAAASVSASRKVVRMQSVAAALYFLQAQLSVEDAERFWEMMATGMILPEDASVLALRETMMNRIAKGTLNRQQDAAYLIIRAWNTWRRGIVQKSFLLPKYGLTAQNFPKLI